MTLLLVAANSTFFLAGLAFFLAARRRSERASRLALEAAAQRRYLAEHFAGLDALRRFLASPMGVAESIGRCRLAALDLARVQPEHWGEPAMCVAHDLDYLETHLRALQDCALDAKVLDRSATYQARRLCAGTFLAEVVGLDDAFLTLAATHAGCPGTSPPSKHEIQLSEEYPPAGRGPRRSAHVTPVEGAYMYPVAAVDLTELPPVDARCACPPTAADFEWLRRTDPTLSVARRRHRRERALEDEAYLARLEELSSVFRRRAALGEALREAFGREAEDAIRCLSRLACDVHGFENMRGDRPDQLNAEDGVAPPLGDPC